MDVSNKYWIITSDRESSRVMTNFWLFIPEFTITALAFGVIGADLFLARENKKYLPWISSIGLIVVLGIALNYLLGKQENLYG